MPELRNQRTFRYVPLSNNDESSTNFYENANGQDVDGGRERDCNNTRILANENHDRRKLLDSNLRGKKNERRRELNQTKTNPNQTSNQYNLKRSTNDVTNVNILSSENRKSMNENDGNCDDDFYRNDVNLSSTISSSSSSSSSTAVNTLNPTIINVATTGTTIINPNKKRLNMLANCLQCSQLMKMVMISLGMILLYLTLSICLIFYQKSLIKVIKLPFSIVTYHLCVKLLMATTIRYVYNYYKSLKSNNNSNSTSNTIINNNHKLTNRIDWKIAVRKLAPTGIFSGIDIGFSNWALELVPISLYTMTKSSSIIFILLFAILLGLEKKVYNIISVINWSFRYKTITEFNVTLLSSFYLFRVYHWSS